MAGSVAHSTERETTIAWEEPAESGSKLGMSARCHYLDIWLLGGAEVG